MTASAEIKASDVAKLRQATGAGLMDSKKALVDAAGDFDKAMKLLRERGIAKSSKRADRTAGEGVVESWISADGKEGILFEMNSETDFVARNDEFLGLAKKILGQIKDNPSWTSVDSIPKDDVLALSGKIGEKIEPRRFVRMKTANGVVAVYIHAGAKLGVLVQIDSKKPAGEAAKELAREVAIQIAGATPNYIHRNEVPAEILEREKDITKKQMEGQNKPADILEKIAVGKLQQFFAANCLLDQAYVREPSGKTTIQQLVDEAAKKEGSELTIAKFARFRVGAD